MTVSGLIHRYQPRGSAVALMGERGAEVLMAGPAGTGKSRACLEKLHLLMLKYPSARGLIVRKTAASLGSSALKTWREHVIPEALARGTVSFYGGSAEQSPQYRYDNGSTVSLGGLDRPSKIMSTEYDTIFAQEATELTVDDWEALSTRLRNGVIPYQQMIADCNPDTPTHWLLARCNRGQTRMIHCRHEDNPVLFDETPDGYVITQAGTAYMARLDALTGVRYQRLRLGLWVAAEGVIYEDFQPAVHVIDRFEVPWEWPRYWSIDFGYTNPFVCQRWAEDPDGRLYLYAEHYMTGRTVDRHARDILAAVTDGSGVWVEPQPQCIVADHDSENRARFEQELGFGTRAADKRVLHGIQLVQARLKPAGDGKPRVFFFRDALAERDPVLDEARKPCQTLDELPGYVWAPDPTGKATKESPLKKDDHGADACRYLVAERDPGSLPRIRMLR